MHIVMLLVNNYEWDARVRRQAEALARAKHRVTVIALKNHHCDGSRDTLNGVNIVRLPIRKFRGDSVLNYLRYYSHFAARAIIVLNRIGRVDLIQAHSMPEFLVICGLLHRLRGTVLVLDVHDLSSRLFRAKFGGGRVERLVKFSEAVAMLLSDMVLTVHERYAEIIRNEYPGKSAKNVAIIRNLPDPHVWRPRDFVPWGVAPVYGFHGTLSHRNGVIDLVQAFALVKKRLPLAQLWLVGDGEAREEIDALVAAEGLEESVMITRGYVPIEEVQRILKGVHIGVSACRRDVFTEDALPTKALEYAASNIPVVASDLPLLLQSLPGGSIWCFPAGSVAALANAMIGAASDEAEAYARAASALSSVGGWGDEEHRYVSLLNQAVAIRSRR